MQLAGKQTNMSNEPLFEKTMTLWLVGKQINISSTNTPTIDLNAERKKTQLCSNSGSNIIKEQKEHKQLV